MLAKISPFSSALVEEGVLDQYMIDRQSEGTVLEFLTSSSSSFSPGVDRCRNDGERPSLLRRSSLLRSGSAAASASVRPRNSSYWICSMLASSAAITSSVACADVRSVLMSATVASRASSASWTARHAARYRWRIRPLGFLLAWIAAARRPSRHLRRGN